MTETMDDSDGSSRFKKIAWDSFEFDEVIADLLRPRAFPYEHKLLVRALGAWVIAPNHPDDRKDAVRAGVRLAVARYEREVFRLPREQQLDKISRIWQEQIGHQFFAEVYAPLGGISALNRSTETRERRRLVRKCHHAAFRNLQAIIKLIHHASLQNWPAEKYHKISLNRCYKALCEFNTRKLMTPRYATEKQLQTYLQNYGKTAVLAYAARQTPIGDGRDLFSIFTGQKSIIPDRVEVLNNWLAAVGYLNREVVSLVVSKGLAFSQSFSAVSERSRTLPTPVLTDPEMEAFERVMHISYAG